MAGGTDYVVVGAGLAGAIIARKLAEKNKKILLLEKRGHIGGNAYDYVDEHGIRVQKYGPHVFHANEEEVFQFIEQYCSLLPYTTRCEAVLDNVSTPSPFNFRTIDQFYSPEEAKQLKTALLQHYPGRLEVPIAELLQAEEPLIRQYAEFLFEKDYRLYTAKQWNLQPSQIDPSVMKRVPVILSYRDTFFRDKFEGIPADGYTSFFERLLDHPNITVRLQTNALPYLTVEPEQSRILFQGKEVKIVYTGPVDELFQYRYGILPYRSLYFCFASYETDSFQNASIVAYPQEKSFTRITEYTKMPEQNGRGWTSVAYEYPVAYDKEAERGNEPYYPILTEESQEMYQKYREYARRFENLTLCGRLAEFKYYNMDQVILRALEFGRMLT